MNKINLIRYPLKNVPVISCQLFQVRLRSSKKESEGDSQQNTSDKATKNTKAVEKLNLLLKSSKKENEGDSRQNTSDKTIENTEAVKKLNLKSNKKGSKGDSQQGTLTKTTKNVEAVEKLNLLLKQIIEDDAVSSTSNLQLAKPKPKKNAKEETKTDSDQIYTTMKDVISSVKDVAETLGGDVKQTESELLSKLLNATDTQVISSNLSEIVKGMKIDRETKSAESVSRAEQVRNILKTSKESKSAETSQAKFSRRRTRDADFVEKREREKINLFGEESLGIFSDVSQFVDSEINKTWKKLYNRELRLAVTHPPENYFQEMILWTEQGKVWKFPIDNEQGMEEEQKVYFAEHVFLEKHLEPWCPPKGPIRHFMELVCIGLSKNPYMSVKVKQEHIAWYRDYFQDKQKLLEEIGAVPKDFKLKIEGVTQGTE